MGTCILPSLKKPALRSFEIGTQDIKPKDSSDYLAFLNSWAGALNRSGLVLQYDLGGCNDPYATDFMGLTCAELRQSALHRLIPMDSYAGPVACSGQCNFTLAIEKDMAALCDGGADGGAEGCARYQPGLMLGKPGALADLGLDELIAKMDWLLGRGVRKMSLWAGAPSEEWWSAMGHFLTAPVPARRRGQAAEIPS